MHENYARKKLIQFANEVEVYYFNGKSFTEAVALVKCDWAKRERDKQ